MPQDLDLKNMDRRLVDRFVRRGEVSDKELDKTLKQLPDQANEAQPVESRFEPLEGQD